MSFKLIADTFSVSRDTEHFIQLKTLKKPNSEDQVWLAIEIIGDSKYARATSQSIIDTMEEVFFDKPELGAYERFELTLKEVNIIINSLKEKRKKAFGQINAIIAVFSGTELHLTQCNNAEAYLIRHNKFSMVSEGLGSRSEDLFVNIASGEVASDDKLIFSTVRLLRLATHSQIVQLFSDGVAEAIEAIRELTLADEELSFGVVAIHAKSVQKSIAKLENAAENKVWIRIKGMLGAALNFVSEKTSRKSTNVNKKKVLIAIAAIAVILIISVSILMQNSRNNAIREEYRTRISELNNQIQTANTKGYANDKGGANTILDKVEKDAREILATNYFRTEVLDILDKIQGARDNINNTERLKELAPYIDLTAKKSDVNALGLTSMGDNLFVYEFNRLYEVILDQVLDPKTIDATEVVIAGTAMEDQDVLVFLTQSGKVMEYENGQMRFANTEDETWKSGVDIASYGKYIYILSPENNQIYKYGRLRSKYSGRTDYNIDADLKDTLSITIDGDIYVLKKGGEIVKLYKSNVQPFKIENLAVDISDASQIFTSQELDNLYLLDIKNNRVVILEKNDTGTSRYYGQIVFEELTNVKRIYVEKSENKLYVLTDKEIYKIDI